MTTDHIPPVSDETLAELLELEAKATPGEWTRLKDSECIVTGLKEKRGGYMRYEYQICTMSGESEVSADELFDHYYNGDVVRDEGGDPLDLSKLSVGDRADYNWMWDGDLIAKSRNSLRSIVRELQERRAAEKKEWRCAVDFIDGPAQVGRLSDSLQDIRHEHRSLIQRWDCRIQYRTIGPWTDAEPARADKEGKSR